MHSPWGVKFQILKETNLTWHEAMWKVSRANQVLMLADRSAFKERSELIIEESGKQRMARRKAKS